MPDFMTLHEASNYLHIAENTLRWYRTCGTGPVSFRLGGKVMYDRADLDTWIATERAASVRGGE